jgi:hypothetical protein
MRAQQAELFDLESAPDPNSTPEVERRVKALRRMENPEPSHKGAEEVTMPGRKQQQMETLLKMIKRRPGHTAAEYSVLLYAAGMDFYIAARMPNKRVTDLVNEGKIRAGLPRECGKTGREARTFYPMDD